MLLMKKQVLFICLISFAVIGLNACDSNAEKTETAGMQAVANEEEEKSPEQTQSEAVCIWNNISVRQSPSQEGKWLTSLSLGEQLTTSSEKAMDSVKDREYVRIILKDGTEGWAMASFVVADAKAAAVKESANLYKRPDLLTKTDEAFSATDIVAVISTDGDWAQVKGQRTGDSWIDEGWVKTDNLSYDAVDLAVAKFAREAMAKEDPADRDAALNDILSNSDFASSVFFPALRDYQRELQESL